MISERISISAFNPLRLSIPKVELFVGKVSIVLPDIHVQIYDLSMGIELLRGAHIGADGQVFSLNMTIPEPGISPAQMMEMIYTTQGTLEKMWKIAQKELDKQGALLG